MQISHTDAWKNCVRFVASIPLLDEDGELPTDARCLLWCRVDEKQVPGRPGLWVKQGQPCKVPHKKVTAVQIQHLPRTGSTHALDNGIEWQQQHAMTHGVQPSNGHHFTVVVDIERSRLQVSVVFVTTQTR